MSKISAQKLWIILVGCLVSGSLLGVIENVSIFVIAESTMERFSFIYFYFRHNCYVQIIKISRQCLIDSLWDIFLKKEWNDTRHNGKKIMKCSVFSFCQASKFWPETVTGHGRAKKGTLRRSLIYRKKEKKILITAYGEV